MWAERLARRNRVDASVPEVAIVIASRCGAGQLASNRSFHPGLDGEWIQPEGTATNFLSTFVAMREADRHYEYSELVERASLSAQIDALTASQHRRLDTICA